MITLTPPQGAALYKVFTLNSGHTYQPNFARGGQVKVTCEQDALELESEGWERVLTPTETRTQDALRHAANESATRRRRL